MQARAVIGLASGNCRGSLDEGATVWLLRQNGLCDGGKRLTGAGQRR